METERPTNEWAHLHLTGWPFRTVPDEAFARIWADRSGLLDDVNRMMFRWSRPGPSTLHLMWADLGAGKTHTLQHIRLRCLENPKLGILPVYAVMPRYIRSFVEVYVSIIAAMGAGSLSAMFMGTYGSVDDRREAAEKLFPTIPDVAKALQVLALGSDMQRDLAAEWLRAARLTRRQLDSIGITRLIRTTDDAVAVLSGLVQVVESTGRYRRLLVMLDECQRLGNFTSSIGRDINTGLHTWFNASPRMDNRSILCLRSARSLAGHRLPGR